jgi:hypothetical protein
MPRIAFALFVALASFSGRGLEAAPDAAQLLNGYHEVSVALAADRYADTRAAAERWHDSTEEVLAATPSTDATLPFLAELRDGFAGIADTTDAKAQRAHFGTLSEGATKLVRQLGATSGWVLYFCPMVEGWGFWTQPKGEHMANPYMGTEMLECGVKKAWAKLPQ